jgi:hypothetical protein
MIPALDPLIPATVRAVVHWGEGREPVSIVHDQQTRCQKTVLRSSRRYSASRTAIDDARAGFERWVQDPEGLRRAYAYWSEDGAGWSVAAPYSRSRSRG